MSYFDFSEEVRKAVDAAPDRASRLSAKTSVYREQFPSAVRRAGFNLIDRDSHFEPGDNDLVVGVAPWSDSDLAVLESLALQSHALGVRVSVLDIDNLMLPGMREKIPGFRIFLYTPVVFHYRDGKLAYFGEGRDALLWLREL